MSSSDRVVNVLDYGAGNVRSLINAIHVLGWKTKIITTPEEVLSSEILVFPGVGAFKSAMDVLANRQLSAALVEYIASGKQFLGICIGLQCLFRSSEENPGTAGLGVLAADVARFQPTANLSVPHMGWNEVVHVGHGVPGIGAYSSDPSSEESTRRERVYFVHSYAVPLTGLPDSLVKWVCGLTWYGQWFVSAVRQGRAIATQFHPEKSGVVGLRFLKSFLEESSVPGGGLPLATAVVAKPIPISDATARGVTTLARRIIACLDVRENEAGDLVVTKGDQYDVKQTTADGRAVRNFGRPVAVAGEYYEAGADEITFLNITAFRSSPVADLPLLAVLKATSEKVFVPLCIGGGIRDYVCSEDGRAVSALEVASNYFRAGADKVSIGTDAVTQSLAWYGNGRKGTGQSSIESISRHYGAQAVVVSVDPKRVWEDEIDRSTPFPIPPVVVASERDGKPCNCIYQCTIKGGRELAPLDVGGLAVAVEALGAGELLINCIDRDGQCNGYDIPFISAIRALVSIPVIASSGAGKPEHFSEVFKAEPPVQAALAAGIFHRHEVAISAVKAELLRCDIPVRVVDQ